MAEVIGVRFKDAGKIYYFAPNGNKLNTNNMVVVETSRGIKCGTVAIPNKEVPEEQITRPLKDLIRIATDEDIQHLEENDRKEKEAFKICEEKIKENDLEMNLVDVEYTFDNTKVIFYFTADGRIDFRKLVKDLAAIFKVRIELRQIGVRDESKMMGGLGICGRPFCCHTFLGEFQPVSIKMAKKQGLSLSPTKISGTCGRLMCCLNYEHEAYMDLIKRTPRIGAIVEVAEGRGIVVDSNILVGRLSVHLDNTPEEAPARIYKVEEVKMIKNGYLESDTQEMEDLKHLEE